MEKEWKAYEIGELDQYLFGQGNHYEIYKKLGAHMVDDEGQKGVYFAVWAPNAKSVSVVGEFNDCDRTRNPMTRAESLVLCAWVSLPGTHMNLIYRHWFFFVVPFFPCSHPGTIGPFQILNIRYS